MKERPIIFNTEMVKAVLEGRKIQTRRVVRRIKDQEKSYWNIKELILPYPRDGLVWNVRCERGYSGHIKCPYGKVGDRLWVRETWFNFWGGIIYRAADEYASIVDDDPDNTWKPSIHMPRWASRITLKITDIRVERLQEIKYEGMKAEGCLPKNCCGGERETLRKEYWIPLWNSIYKKENTWQDNPWVWVIEFKVI